MTEKRPFLFSNYVFGAMFFVSGYAALEILREMVRINREGTKK